MRLLQVSLRSLLLYSLILVIISIPFSLLTIRAILMEETDELLAFHAGQFVKHIKNYEYLDDLEMDLGIWDQLSYDVSIIPADYKLNKPSYETVHQFDSTEHENRTFRSLSSYVVIKENPYILTIRMSLTDNDDLLLALGAVQVIMIVLLATGLLLLNRSLSKKLWKPFYAILSQLKAYQVDKNESITTIKTNITEFDDLNETIIHLTERNRKVYLHQKEFIENASHELQTPLAIFQAKLDNLMQNTALSESDASTILELEETTQRMSRLNKDLLLLSKIDNDQFTEREEVSISELTQSYLKNLNEMAATDQLSLSTAIDTVIVTANRTLVEVLLTNLLNNAARHTQAGGKVRIDVKERLFEISNSGKPLKTHPQDIFNRFTKEGDSEQNTGLGLAIVKRICEVSGFQIKYRYQEEMHIFSIYFQ